MSIVGESEKNLRSGYEERGEACELSPPGKLVCQTEIVRNYVARSGPNMPIGRYAILLIFLEKFPQFIDVSTGESK